MKRTAFFFLTVVISGLIGCSEFKGTTVPDPVNPDAIKQAEKPSPMKYEVLIEPFSINSVYEELVKFKIPKMPKEDQAFSIHFNFNSKAAEKLKIFKVESHSVCTVENVKLTYNLVKVKPEREVISENFELHYDFKLQKNTDYAIEATGDISSCSEYSIGFSSWTGPALTEPAAVRECDMKNNTQDFSYFHLVSEAIPQVFFTHEKKLLGQKVVCGKSIDSSHQKFSTDFKNYETEGLIEGKDGSNYSYELNYSEDGKEGEVICRKDGSLTDEYTLESCKDVVRDKKLFKIIDN